LARRSGNKSAPPAGKHSATLYRDTWGVPHIYANTPADAHFGLGFVHAQDRLWQMECQRRLAMGRLSEIFGSRSVSGDQLVRTVGLHRAAEAAWQSLPADAKADVEAYTRGVNACLARLRGLTLPPEFLLLRVRPEPWRPVDVVACTKLLALQLNFTYTADLLRGELIETLGVDRAAALMPFADDDARPHTAGAPDATGAGLPADRSDEAPVEVAHVAAGREGYGSNQWVVAGARSATGAPTLACDPHMPSSAPSSWYVAHLCAGPLDAIGATLPGVPGVIVGRNRYIAWGTANLSADVQDLFRERLSADGRDVEASGRMEPMQHIDEVIRVRRGKPVPVAVRATGHGPLISDAINATRRRAPAATRPPDSEPLALRWTALDPIDTTLAAVFALNVARDWNSFRGALREYVVPPIAFSYADVHGTIGLQVAGRVPVRRSGDGSAPGEGWSGTTDWVGSIPFDALPAIHNPASGLVVSANADIAPAGYPHFLGRPFVEPHRQRRITELLTARPRLHVHDHLTIQGDTMSVHARELLPALLRLTTAATPREVEALDALRAWDHDMHADSAAAAVFAAWWLRLPRALLEPEIGARRFRALETWVSFTDRFVRRTLHEAETTGDADRRMRGVRIVHDCLREALGDLERRLGADLRAWRWGRVHRAVFPHQPFHSVPWVNRWFSRVRSTGGDWSTISVGGTWTIARPFEQRYVAGYRQVIDLSTPDGGQFIHAMGQSGHVLSPHYDDYLDDWAACRTRPLRLERSTVDRATKGAVLILRPRSAAPQHHDTKDKR
jgi:penicillin amidase